MVIDDEPIVGKRLKRLLEKEGYDIKVFTEGTAAIEELEKRYFDIIITDLKMENADGMKILSIAKMLDPYTKVIIITGFAQTETAKDALDKGAFAFIIKPFKIEDLKNVVKRAGQERKS